MKTKFFNTERQAENYLKNLGYRYSPLTGGFWIKGMKKASVQGNAVVFHGEETFKVKKFGKLITSIN